MPIGDAGELKERSLSNYDWKCGKEYREILLRVVRWGGEDLH